MGLKDLPKMSLDDIKEKFNMRLLGGEVTIDKYAKFNSLRHTLTSKNPEYERFLGTKSRAVRMFVDVFIEYPNALMEMAEKLNIGVKNDQKIK